jgi:hypothetical protein
VSSDFSLVSEVEVSGHRRGAIPIEDSHHCTISGNLIHDSVVRDTDTARQAGNDIYMYGSSSWNLSIGNQIRNGSGVGCSIQTSGTGKDVADHYECSNDLVDGEPNVWNDGLSDELRILFNTRYSRITKSFRALARGWFKAARSLKRWFQGAQSGATRVGEFI